MHNIKPVKFMLWLITAIVIIVTGQIMIGGASALTGVETVDPTVDSELRFMTIFWLGYGLFTFLVFRNLRNPHQFVPAIALLPIAGGGARLLSWARVGRPDDTYVVGIVVEFVIGALTLFFNWQFRKRNNMKTNIWR